MTHVLQIRSSIFDDREHQGISSQLGDELVASLAAREGVSVQVHDFSTSPVPYFDHDWLQALSTPAEQRSSEQARKVAYSDGLIAELKQADVLVIGVPMYNFTVPAMLKSWTDHVARAGVTFRYTETGPVGLLTGKQVVLVLSTGGRHDEGVSDFMRPYLRTILGFLGMKELEIVLADGLNMGEASRAEGLLRARKQMENLHIAIPGRAGEAA